MYATVFLLFHYIFLCIMVIAVIIITTIISSNIKMVDVFYTVVLLFITLTLMELYLLALSKLYNH